MQGLKEVTMHEVGHTLGLRHNFKASTHLTLEQANDTNVTKEQGLAASVMDYLPPNIVRAGQEQGDFYSTTIGPYDKWAIEYGYTELSGGTQSELPKLREIAARSGEPGLAYATDENTRGIDPDPYSNRFDLGDDPLAYARHQAALVQELMPKVTDRLIGEGEDYSAARQAFNVLLAEHGRTMFFVARFVGGIELSRSHKGDKDAAPPFQSVDLEKQREALDLLEEQVFSDEPYQVDPQLYSFLAPSQWSHWGVDTPLRPDFPVHEVIEMWQVRVLQQLLSPLTLERIHDAELKVAPDQDAFTVAELLERLTASIFAELSQWESGTYTTRQPAVSSLRRNLQRQYVTMSANVSLGRTSALSGLSDRCVSAVGPIGRAVGSGQAAKRIGYLHPRPFYCIDGANPKGAGCLVDAGYALSPARRTALIRPADTTGRREKEVTRAKPLIGTGRCVAAGEGRTGVAFALRFVRQCGPRHCVPITLQPIGWKRRRWRVLTVKMLLAIIRPTKLQAVREVLKAIGVERMTVCDAHGYGRQRGQTETYRGVEYKINLLRKVVLEVVVNDDFVDRTVETIENVRDRASKGILVTVRSSNCRSTKRSVSVRPLREKKLCDGATSSAAGMRCHERSESDQ